MAAYATKGDLFKYGLPRGALANPGRLVESCLASTDVLTLEGHGFETNDQVQLRATDGGTLSAPLVAGTTYYVIKLTDSTFKLAATSGGTAIDITTNGVSMLVATPLPVDDVLEFYSRFVDAFLPAEFVPLTAPYPVTVAAIVAELAAKKLLLISGQTSESMEQMEIGAKAQLERYAKGLPLRGVASSAQLAIVSTSDPRGWGSGSLP